MRAWDRSYSKVRKLRSFLFFYKEVGDLPIIEADPMQMHQLFQNLIGNGIKFHRTDEPPIIAIQSKSLPGNQVDITVKDHDIGFDPEHAGRLFQPYQRLHGRSKFDGTGKGLSICQRIVERHGGSISAQGVPGEGSTFIVELHEKSS